MNDLIKMMQNPQGYAMQLLQNNPSIKNNQIVANALNMAQRGDTKGLEELANNLANSNGMNLSQITSRLGIK